MILIVLPPTISNVVGEIGRSSWYLVKIPHSGAKTPFIFVKMRMLLYIYYIMSTYKVIAILIPATCHLLYLLCFYLVMPISATRTYHSFYQNHKNHIFLKFFPAKALLE